MNIFLVIACVSFAVHSSLVLPGVVEPDECFRRLVAYLEDLYDEMLFLEESFKESSSLQNDAINSACRKLLDYATKLSELPCSSTNSQFELETKAATVNKYIQMCAEFGYINTNLIGQEKCLSHVVKSYEAYRHEMSPAMVNLGRIFDLFSLISPSSIVMNCEPDKTGERKKFDHMKKSIIAPKDCEALLAYNEKIMSRPRCSSSFELGILSSALEESQKAADVAKSILMCEELVGLNEVVPCQEDCSNDVVQYFVSYDGALSKDILLDQEGLSNSPLALSLLLASFHHDKKVKENELDKGVQSIEDPEVCEQLLSYFEQIRDRLACFINFGITWEIEILQRSLNENRKAKSVFESIQMCSKGVAHQMVNQPKNQEYRSILSYRF